MDTQIVASARFILGFALFGGGMVLIYRVEFSDHRALFISGCACVFTGAALLIALPWPS